MKNEQTTYAYTGEKLHAIHGRYVIGNHYLCVKDDSLLDSQILLIDENEEKHWEDCHNFQCSLTPILIHAIVEYEIDLQTKREYLINKVWYDEWDDECLVKSICDELTRHSSHPVKVLKIMRGGFDGF